MSKGFFNNLFDYTIAGAIRKPLKEATGLTDAQLLGLGAVALTGGMAAPALLGAGTAGAGAAAAGAAGAAEGAALGAGAAGASTAATGAAATEAAAAGAGSSGGLLSAMGTYGKPALQGLQAAQTVQQMSQGHATPMQPGQVPQYQDMGGLLAGGDLQAMQQKRMARRGLLGGA